MLISMGFSSFIFQMKALNAQIRDKKSHGLLFKVCDLWQNRVLTHRTFREHESSNNFCTFLCFVMVPTPYFD